jgi:hypothetical protein
MTGEDLPDWLLFSPSSSEGRSLEHGHPPRASLATSFADVIHWKGKAPMVELEPSSGHSLPRQHPDSVSSGFMADARRAAQCSSNPQQPRLHSAAANGWTLVTHRKQWHRVVHHSPPLPLQCPILADLVSCCFTSLRADHIAAACPNAVCCLHCHREGHQAHSYKRPWGAST